MNAIKTLAACCCGFIFLYITIVIVLNAILLEKVVEFLEKLDKKCQEYEKIACDHKLPDNATIGGKYPIEGLFPHMAFIVDKENSNLTCAGTLISDQFVLTTAHCSQTITQSQVKLGSLTSKIDDTGEWFNVSASYQHNLYRNQIGSVDVALLKLHKRVKFSPYIRPICLGAVVDFEKNTDITASGWSTDENKQSFHRLRVVNLQKPTNDEQSRCEEEFNKKSYYQPALIYCFVLTLQNNTACPRTIGGSLQYKRESKCPNAYTQFGMAAEDVFSKQCEGRTEGPVFVLHISFGLSAAWIAEKVWPDDNKISK